MPRIQITKVANLNSFELSHAYSEMRWSRIASSDLAAESSATASADALWAVRSRGEYSAFGLFGQPTQRTTRVEVHSSDVLRNSGARRPVQELDAVSDENSRGKLQNVVVNSNAECRRLRLCAGPVSVLASGHRRATRVRLRGSLSTKSSRVLAGPRCEISTFRQQQQNERDDAHEEASGFGNSRQQARNS